MHTFDTFVVVVDDEVSSTCCVQLCSIVQHNIYSWIQRQTDFSDGKAERRNISASTRSQRSIIEP